MPNALDSVFHALGPKDLWEIRTVNEDSSYIDSPLDTPVLTTIKIRIYGIFGATLNKMFSKVAWEENVNAFVAVRNPIHLTSQVECDNILYEIIQEIKGQYYLGGSIYLYGLERREGVPGSA